MDQVIGDLHIAHRTEHTRAREHVTHDELDVSEAHAGDRLERALDAGAVACERPYVVALLEQAGKKRRAGKATHARQENAHNS